MSQNETEPQFISLDLEQWRRDIQAFATTTRGALNAIVSELSNQCSGKPGTRPVSLAREASTEATLPLTSKPATALNRPKPLKPSTGSTASDAAATSEGRLSRLKQKLADRLGRS